MSFLKIENLFFTTIFLKEYNCTHFIFGLDLDDIKSTLLELYPDAVQIIIASASDYYQFLQNKKDIRVPIWTIVSYNDGNLIFEEFLGDGYECNKYHDNILAFKCSYGEMEKLNSIIQNIFSGKIKNYLLSDKILSSI